MRLWLKVRRARASVVAIVLIVAVLLLLGGVAIPAPGVLTFHGLALPGSLLAPLILSTAVGYGLTVGDGALESVAVRPMALLDMTYALAAALAMLAAAAALQSLALAPLGYAAGRNALGFVGLVLIGRRLIGGQGATLFPAVLVVFAAIFGGDAFGEPRWWAWLASPHDDQRSWAFALGLLVLGALSASGLRLRRR